MLLECFIHQADNSDLFFSFCENFSKLSPGFGQIIIVESGCAILKHYGKTFFVQAGMMILRSPNTVFDVVYSYNLSALSIAFRPEQVYANVREAFLSDPSDLLSYLKLSETKILAPNPLYRARAKELFMSSIAEMINRKDSSWRVRATGYLKQLFRLCFFNLHPCDNDHICAELARKALEYIHTNYNREITVRMLCHLLHTNHTSLLQAFRKFTGTTIGQYILEFRLNLVSNALIFTHMTIEEIAEEYGFEHASYLSRVFRSRVGMAPGQFRSYVCSKSNTA